jgi:hypothetical protein
MKLTLLQKPSRRNLLRQWSSSRSTFWVDRAPSKVEVVEPPTAPRRRVCFSEDCEVYDNHRKLTEREIEKRWYSSEDMQGFREETARIVATVLNGSKHETTSSWCRTLQSTWRHFARATSPSHVKGFRLKLEVSLATVGLEKWMIHSTVKDALRQRIQSDVFRLQNASYFTDESERSEQMRMASQERSRVARLYAYHIARAAVARQR